MGTNEGIIEFFMRYLKLSKFRGDKQEIIIENIIKKIRIELKFSKCKKA